MELIDYATLFLGETVVEDVVSPMTGEIIVRAWKVVDIRDVVTMAGHSVEIVLLAHKKEN